jgi:U5 small nuclear ribonucleoprotein component
VPKTKYTTEFLTTLMEAPELIRNVAVIGALHHGKTLLMDLLIQQTQARDDSFLAPTQAAEGRMHVLTSCGVGMLCVGCAGEGVGPD